MTLDDLAAVVHRRYLALNEETVPDARVRLAAALVLALRDDIVTLTWALSPRVDTDDLVAAEQRLTALIVEAEEMER